MDRRDQELLDKQLGHVGPARRNDGVVMLTIVVVFLAGVMLGSFLFAGQDEPPMQTASVQSPVPAIAR